MRLSRIIPVLAVFLVLAYGCGPKRVSSVQYGSSSAASKVLFATEDTEFKNAVLDDVVKAFANRDVFIQVTSLDSLEKINPQDFQAIVLVNTCMAWRLEPEISSFIKRVNQPEKVLVLTTTGDDDLTIQAPGVDSVTSASQMEVAGDISRKIIRKMEQVLAKS